MPFPFSRVRLAIPLKLGSSKAFEQESSIGRFLVNGCKERVGTERVGKMSGNGYGRKKREGKINGNGYGLKETEATNGN